MKLKRDLVQLLAKFKLSWVWSRPNIWSKRSANKLTRSELLNRKLSIILKVWKRQNHAKRKIIKSNIKIFPLKEFERSEKRACLNFDVKKLCARRDTFFHEFIPSNEASRFDRGSLRTKSRKNGTSPLGVADRLAEIAIFTLAPPCGAFKK